MVCLIFYLSTSKSSLLIRNSATDKVYMVLATFDKRAGEKESLEFHANLFFA